MNGLTKLLGNAGKTLMKCKPIAKVVVKCSKNKPTIMAVTGGVSVLAAFGLAIYAGIEVKDRMAESAEKVEEIEARQKKELSAENLTEEQKAEIIKACQKELGKARAEGVWQVAKLFILPSGLLVVGLVLIGGGHKILKKRNVVLGMAAEGYKKTLDFYRKNVIADQGEEADKKYMNGVVGEKEIEKIVTDDKGKEVKVKTKIPVIRDHKNPWRFIFDETYFRSYENDTERNLFFLKCEQEWWNHEFDRNEEVSMYEVLKHLGYNFEVDKDGMSKQQYRDWITFLRNYGWMKGSGGDDFIDFGLYRAINEAAFARKSDVVWIEFNCDGNLTTLTDWPYAQDDDKNNSQKYKKGR